MFRTKLNALDHPAPENIDFNDPKEFRKMVLWLEDQKIRVYKIEDRAALRKVTDPVPWDVSYENYKKEIGMPILKTRIEELSWLISYAVRLEYYDNVTKYKSVTVEKIKSEQTFAPSIKSTNPFDTLDFHSKDFEDGVRNLAAKLNIPHHQDHLLLLRAVALALKNNLSTEALKLPLVEGKPFPIFDGANVAGADKDLESAAQILRLLQVQSVRELQTAINETIVNVQNVTADPKTDSKLGKVGF